MEVLTPLVSQAQTITLLQSQEGPPERPSTFFLKKGGAFCTHRFATGSKSYVSETQGLNLVSGTGGGLPQFKRPNNAPFLPPTQALLAS